MKKILRSEPQEIDLTLDNVMEIGGGKQYSWVFRVPKNARKLIISSSYFPKGPGNPNGDEKPVQAYQWETTEELALKEPTS